MKSKYYICILSAVLILFFSACRPAAPTESKGDAKPAEHAGEIIVNAGASDLAALKIATAQWQTVSTPLLTTGTLAFNPKKLAYIAPRVSGRIETVSAFEGDRVLQGQVLLTIYSPELIDAQAEYLLISAQHAGRLNDPQSAALVQSAHAKLEFLGLHTDEIQEIERSRKPKLTASIRAPYTASILESQAVVGAHTEPTQSVMKIADLSTLWVWITLHEKDLSAMRVHADATVTVNAYPGETFKATLDRIGEVVNEETRTIKGRLEMNNSQYRLKPGMFVNVALSPVACEKVLLVPENAIRRVEGQVVVFIPLAANRFQPRAVVAGRTFNTMVEIISGLHEGEQIVADGTFMLKAEALKKNLQGGE